MLRCFDESFRDSFPIFAHAAAQIAGSGGFRCKMASGGKVELNSTIGRRSLFQTEIRIVSRISRVLIIIVFLDRESSPIAIDTLLKSTIQRSTTETRLIFETALAILLE